MGNSGQYLRISGLVPESIVDGPGLRMTIFTQGCPHHCPGCHNPQTHSPTGGRDCGLDEILEAYRENPLLSGVTFSGGEPFLQAETLACLGLRIHALAGDVVTYTGYTLEELLDLALEDMGVAKLLAETDLLIDGPFIQAQASLELPFRGSANQRILPKSEFGHLIARPARALGPIRPESTP